MEARLNFIAREPGLRLDKMLAGQMADYSRSRIQRLIEDGFVMVNGAVSKSACRLEAGDVINVIIPSSPPSGLVAQKMPLDIIYEDDDIIVVDKPAGLSVHPGPGHPDKTLVNAVLGYAPNVSGGEEGRPGIVHRLDKDTSGIIIIARHPKAHLCLVKQFKNREVKKTYIALVKGRLSPETGFIEAPIGRNRSHRKKMAIAGIKNGREARTGYRVKEYINEFTLLEVMPETGRPHQIRVHLAAIGHPILGDSTYGTGSGVLPRQFLHASKIEFRLPSSGKGVVFETPLPPDLEEALAALRA
ncbi:MAG: RluA family pseudouridine synthase [Dehalococcoidales bacterium]|nr:RluA family pseudouridine synthase [Dehalococcoidales bacterium]